MDGVSIWHWLIVLIWVSTAIPVVKILNKAGFSGWWAILAFVPLLNLIGLWTFAFVQWHEPRRGHRRWHEQPR